MGSPPSLPSRSPAAPRARRLSGDRRALLLFGLLPAALGAGAAVVPVSDPDTGWHLAAGRLILSGRFPGTNTLSWTFPDEPWRFTQWLAGTLLALGESLAGPAGILAVTALFAAATLVLLSAAVRRAAPSLSAPAFLSLLLPAAAFARPRFVPRGDVASLAGVALVHHLCLARPRRLPLLLFLAAAVWSNLHAGVVFGLLVVGLHFGGRVLERQEGALREGAAAVSAFLAGSLANPNFHYPYVYLLENVAVARRFPFPIAELMPPGPFGHPPFTALALLTGAAAILAARERRFALALPAAFGAALGFSGARFLPFLPLLALPLLAAEIGTRLDALRERLGSRGGAAAFSALLLLPGGAFAGWELSSRPPGTGVDARRLPAGAAEHISSRNLSGRLFNDFNLGGYLAWKLHPRQRVFVDGRGNAYPWKHFEALASLSPGSLAPFLDRWAVDVAVLDRRPEAGGLSWAPAFASLGWTAVHADGASFTFVRPGSADGARSSADAFRLVRPWKDPAAAPETVLARPAEVAAELRRIDPSTLLLPSDFRNFGSLALLAGDLPLAARFLDEGRALHPGDPSIRYHRGHLLAASGRRGEAAEELRWVSGRAAAPELAALARRDLAALGLR